MYKVLLFKFRRHLCKGSMGSHFDPAYHLGIHLQGPFRGNNLTTQMELYNKSMSEVKVAVELLFGNITNYSKFIDFKRQMTVNLSAVGKCILYAPCWKMLKPVCIVMRSPKCLELNPLLQVIIGRNDLSSTSCNGI